MVGRVYKNSFEHISEELERLDLLIKIQKYKLKESAKNDKFRGLFISEQEINSILKDVNPESISEQEDSVNIEHLDNKITSLEEAINEKVKNSLTDGVYISLPHLSRLFNLTRFEEEVLIICLAPELDKKYEKLYAYLNDDVSQKKPTIDLIFQLTCKTKEEKIAARAFLSKQSTLFKYNILQMTDDEQSKITFPSCSIKLDERIVNFLLEVFVGDYSIEPFAKLLNPNEIVEELVSSVITSRLEPLIQSYMQGDDLGGKVVLNFFGPDGCGKKTTAQALCKKFGISILAVDCSEIISRDLPLETTLLKASREATISGAALYLDNFSPVFEKEDKTYPIPNSIAQVIRDFPWLAFVATQNPWNNEELLQESLFMGIGFSKPTYPERKLIWKSIILKAKGVSISDDIDLEMLANKFAFTPAQIIDAVNFARNLSLARSTDNAVLTMSDLSSSCRSVSNQGLVLLTKKIDPNYTWSDIVLPEKTIETLQDICNHVKNKQFVYHDWGFGKKFSLGKGLIVLFKGETGTGKTMASEVIANELDLDLYKIDLSSIVSKYIGETEKNLNKIFNEAESSNAILFFDEADALFGKRSEVKDAHDRYANVETNYLLQKMDEYEGIVILATNFQKNIDTAFTRRMNFIVDFPFPDSKHRIQIWKNSFPKEAVLEKDIDFKFLTNSIRLSGGNIKNIVVNSAFLAAQNSKCITMKDIIHAIKQEYQKMGKPVLKGEFGNYSELLEL